jgi:hypothetical protein
MKFKKNLSLLGLSALILIGLAGCQQLGAGSASAEANSPLGMWTGTITLEDGTTQKVGVIFSSDGTMTVMEESGALGLGVWEKATGNQYRFTFWEYTQQDDAKLTWRVRSTIERSDDKEQFSGPFDVHLSGPDGSIIAEGAGSATFVRNKVEPMP